MAPTFWNRIPGRTARPQSDTGFQPVLFTSVEKAYLFSAGGAPLRAVFGIVLEIGRGWAVAAASWTAALLCLGLTHAAAEPAFSRLVPIPVSNGVFGAHGAASGTCVLTAGPLAPITALAFGADGNTLAVGGYQEVLLWDLTGATLRKRIGQGVLNDSVRALAFRKDGQWLAVGAGAPGRPGTVRVFNVGTGEPVADLSGPNDTVSTLAFSPDGKLLAAGGADSAVRVWNVEGKTSVATLSELHGNVLGVAFSADGRYLAAGAGSVAQVWETGNWKSVWRAAQPDVVNGLAFSPTGKSLAMAIGGQTDHGLRIQQIEYPEPPEEQPAASGSVTAVTTGSTASVPCVPSVSGSVSAATTGSAAKAPEPAKPAPPSPSPAPKNPKKALTQPRTFDTAGATPLGALWGGYGKSQKIYVPCTDNAIRVFDTSGGVLARWIGHDDWVYCVARSPDGNRLASGSADGTVKLWGTDTGRLLGTLTQTNCRTDRWAIVTPQGRFQTSCPEAIQWKTADSKPLEAAVIENLRNPEAVQQILSGVQPTPAPSKPKPKPTVPAVRSAAIASPTVAPKPAPPVKPTAASGCPPGCACAMASQSPAPQKPKPTVAPVCAPACPPATVSPKPSPAPVTPKPTVVPVQPPACPPATASPKPVSAPPKPQQSGSSTTVKP